MTEAPDEHSAVPFEDEATDERAVRTGDPRVDEVLSSMDELDRLPVGEHAGVFEAAHDQLRAALEPDSGADHDHA